MPRSGLLVVLSEQPALELGRRQVAARGVQTFLVVDLLEKHADAGAGLGQIAIFRPVDFLVFQGLDERLAGRIGPAPLTTPDASGLNRRFRIIHPFHPWSGQEFDLVTYLHTWGEHRVYFHKEGEHLVSVPASWTDIVAEDPVVRVAAGRALFRALDLIELAQMLKGLRSRNVKGITSCV